MTSETGFHEFFLSSLYNSKNEVIIQEQLSISKRLNFSCRECTLYVYIVGFVAQSYNNAATSVYWATVYSHFLLGL